MTGWKLRSVEIGALARQPPTAVVETRRRPGWNEAGQVVRAASRALTADDRAALRAELAARVHLQAMDAPPRILSRDEAVEELAAWRRRWRSCDVLVVERLMSGPLLAATGFVVGIDRRGEPSCVDLHLMWG